MELQTPAIYVCQKSLSFVILAKKISLINKLMDLVSECRQENKFILAIIHYKCSLCYCCILRFQVVVKITCIINV